MGKKKRRQSSRKSKADGGNLSVDELLDRGAQALRQEKFQQAIQSFKTVLKQEARPAALAGLGEAYAGRILQLAGKSMFKEAEVMMENMTRCCPGTETATLRLSLCLKAGAYSEAADLFRQYQNLLTPEQIARFEVLFGALLLSGSGVKPEQFGMDSALARFYPVAIESLELFLAGRESEIREAIGKIPLRSPYRDLRSLLAGLLRLGDDQEGCRAFLGKIGEESPYRSLAERYLARFDSPWVILEKLKTAGVADLAQLRQRYGLSEGRFQMLLDLARSNGQPRKLLEIVRRHAACLGKAQQHQLLRNIVPFCGSHAVDLLKFYSTYDPMEGNRLAALVSEKEGDFSSAVGFWKLYSDRLTGLKTARPLEMAQVLRHQAQLMRRDLYKYRVNDVIEVMQKSLEYDPNHVETWLQAADFALKYLSRNQYYAILDTAVQKLPGCVPVLLAAMRASGRRGAHKKAAGLAKRVLDIDSINTGALDFLMESRLEHARKLARLGKWLLAEKELLANDTRVKAVRLRGRGRIALGMLQILQGNGEGLKMIARGKTENGFVVLAALLVALEARLFELPVKDRKQFDEELRQAAGTSALVNKTEVLRLCGWLTGFTGRQWLMLKECCLALKKYLSTAAALDWNREEGILLCKAMDRAGQDKALADCSGRLVKTFPADALFAAWNLIALHEKLGRKVPRTTVARLEDLTYELEDKGEFGLCERLDEILYRHEESDDSTIMATDEDDIFDQGPFRLPSKKSPETKKPVNQPKPYAGKQLNLFDEES